MKSLTQKGLIEKHEKIINNVKFCEYKANYTTGEKIAPNVVKNLHQGGEKITPNVVKNLHQGGEKITPTGGEKITPNNIYNNNIIII